jgi:hypothetical protein
VSLSREPRNLIHDFRFAIGHRHFDKYRFRKFERLAQLLSKLSQIRGTIGVDAKRVCQCHKVRTGQLRIDQSTALVLDLRCFDGEQGTVGNHDDDDGDIVLGSGGQFTDGHEYAPIPAKGNYRPVGTRDLRPER